MTQQTKPLNEVAKVTSGFAFKSSEFAKEGIPIIRISNITNGEDVEILESNQHYYNKELNERIKNSLLKKEDILIALSGATTGKIGIYKEDKPALLNQRIALIRSKDEKSNDYIYYFLQTKSQQILREAYGGAQPNISPTSLKSYEIYWPEKVEERQKIVSAIETQFTRLDSAVSSLKNLKQKLGVYRKAVLKKAFEKEEDWEEKTLGELVETRKEKSNPQKRPNFRYVGMAHVESDSGRILEEHFAKEMKATSSNFYKGDVLYGRLRPYLNKVVDADFEGLCSTEFIILIPKINYKFLGWRLRSLDFVNFANSLNAGDRPRVKIDQISKFKIAFPSSKQEQSSIVSEIESKFSIIDKVEQIVDNSLKKAEMLRKSILKSAFEGKLIKEEIVD